MEQLEQNRDAVEVGVTDQDRAQIDETSLPCRVIVLYYQVDFGPRSFHWWGSGRCLDKTDLMY